MGALSPIQYQYRSFEATYLFKVKNSDQISLKILNLTQDCIFKRVFFSKELSHLDVQYLLKTGSFNQVIERLVERELLPQEHRIPTSKKVTLEACEEMLDQTIKQFKPQIVVERKELKEFECPITFEIFREPVIDEHGHTFEKSAIEAQLQLKNECPINRQPIHTLTANRLVQQTIEGWQQQDPIPTLELFQKENPKLAKTNLQLAQDYAEEKEYNEAIEAYTNAFKYTKNWTDYSAIPALFEEMGESDKANLANLYLAKYQLQAGNINEAIQTLESCQRRQLPQVNLVLIELYYQTEQAEKALALAVDTAASLATEHPDQAISLYRRILINHPTEHHLYLPLAGLLKTPQEKAHTLLKGALEALQAKNYSVVTLLVQQAEWIYADSFVDGLVSLELIKQEGTTAQIKHKLLKLAEAFEAKGLTPQMLSAYKMLFQLDNDPAYSQKIITAYQTLQKPLKQMEWSKAHLTLLISHEQWEQAEALAKQLLQQLPELHERLPLYEKLEEIFTHWHGHELQVLWAKLGKAYRDDRQLDVALKTYQKAFERFHGFEEAIALAEMLHETGKTQDSVHTYYEAAVEALLEQNMVRLSLCTKGIKQIDPHMQHLSLNKRMHLLTQEHILKLSQENLLLRKQILEFSQAAQIKIASLEHIVQPLKEMGQRRIAEEQERTRLAEIERGRVEEEKFSKLCFGKAKWEKYFGDIGIAPPLPEGISEILRSPCPYWSRKQINDTHLLVLIPQSVNGKPFNLNTLQELIQHTQNGGHATKYSNYYDIVRREIGDQSVHSSYWTLITKDVLPKSRKKTYSKQQALLQPSYAVPRTIELATGILTHYVETGERLYSEIPCTYTRCQEMLSDGTRMVVGSFGPYGLNVSYGGDDGYSSRGLGVVRKF